MSRADHAEAHSRAGIEEQRSRLTVQLYVENDAAMHVMEWYAVGLRGLLREAGKGEQKKRQQQRCTNRCTKGTRPCPAMPSYAALYSGKSLIPRRTVIGSLPHTGEVKGSSPLSPTIPCRLSNFYSS